MSELLPGVEVMSILSGRCGKLRWACAGSAVEAANDAASVNALRRVMIMMSVPVCLFRDVSTQVRFYFPAIRL